MLSGHIVGVSAGCNGEVVNNGATGIEYARLSGTSTCTLWNAGGGDRESPGTSACSPGGFVAAGTKQGGCGSDVDIDAFRWPDAGGRPYRVQFGFFARSVPAGVWTQLNNGESAACSESRICVITTTS